MQRSAVKKYESKLTKVINEAKARPCEDCGIEYPSRVMCFHHRDPSEKLFEIGSRLGGMAKILAEIAKCDVLCLNCHALRHMNG